MGEHKNWFARNKGFVFGFAVAVAILNIVIFVLMPQQTPIRIDETVTEYVCGDESFAAEHTIQLTGTLTRSMLAKPLFLGTLRISGVDALAEPSRSVWSGRTDAGRGISTTLTASPLDWQQYGVLSIDADKDLGELLIRLTPDEAQQHFLAPGAASRRRR